MLHGNPTWSYLFRHMIRDLRKDHRCVAVDHLGYGLSDKPPRADYSMRAHIRRLGIVIEKLGLSNITLICQDWGGIIGLSYAARNRERFSRLIPMNTTGFLPRTRAEFQKCMGAGPSRISGHTKCPCWAAKWPLIGTSFSLPACAWAPITQNR